MECDKLDSNSVQGLNVGCQENFGLSSDGCFVDGESGIEKMDGGEKKSGSKKRSTSVEVGFNSDDDEPIGYLFKMKSKRNPKKVRVGLDVGGDKGKQVEVRAEKMLVKDEDFGGMNDTLASFRKKLKGPKKDGGSGSMAGRNLVANAAEPSCQSLNGLVKDGGLAVTSISNIVEKGQIDESGETVAKELKNKAKGKSKRSKAASLLKKTGSDIEFDVVGLSAKSISKTVEKGQIDASEGIAYKELENRGKGKSKRSKIASLLKKTVGDIEFDDVGLAAKSISKVGEKVEVTDDYASNETVDKEFEQRPKGKSKRSRIVSLLEKTGGDIEFDDALDVRGSADNSSYIEKECILRSGGGSNHCLDDNLEDSLSSFFRKAQSGLIRKSRSSSRSKELKRTRPASEVGTIITGSEDSLHLASDKGSIDSTCDQNKDGIHQNPDNTLSQVSNCTQGNFSTGDPRQELSFAPRITYEIRSSDSMHGQSSNSNLEDSISISLHQGSQSCLMECSNKPPRLQEGELNWQTSGIRERPTLGTPGSNHFLDGNSKEYICVKVEDNGSFPGQGPTLGIQNVKDEIDSSTGKASDLVHDVFEMSNLISAPEQMRTKTNHQIDEGVPAGGFADGPDEDYKGIASSHTSRTVQKIHPSLGNEVQGPCFAKDFLNSSCEDATQKTIKQLPCEKFEPSAPPSQKPLACNEKTSVPLELVDGLEFNHCLEDQPHTQFCSLSSAFGSPHKEFTSSDCNKSHRISSACVQEPEVASISSEKEDASASGGRLSPVSPNRFHKYEISFRANHLENFVETDDNPNHSSQDLPVNDSGTSFQKCSSSFHQNQHSGDVCVVGHNPSCYSGDDGASSPSTTPDLNGSYGDDTVSVLDPESKDMKLSAGQRAVRKPKKHRHGDMAYEGDADWEILIHEQDFLVSHQIGDDSQSIKTNKKLNFSSTMVSGAENGGAAAVSSGLKARAAGPVEKIKFKEVLKRKGGLQEYLEYRNHILGLWSKDVSRILPLSECGVSDTPLADEPQCASLVRDIYAFLDHCGYINFGVASKKEIAEAGAEHNRELLEEKKSRGPVADSDDGVSFILGRVKHLETSMEEKNDSILDDKNRAARVNTSRRIPDLQALELSSPTGLEGFAADCYEEKGLIDAKPSNRKLDLAILSSNSFVEVGYGGAAPATCQELQNPSYGVQPASIDHKEGIHCMDCDSEVRKRVIVIGAGPAGLTAARHLQRQGFQVTVLEARSRIGGRVFTDRSSLSVPVDLGASIITGVEADVATERRPDPSSLVCAQLGLELTVLNSDCPLYDIVTGEKVPPDLDESLEEEYNSLLDDTLVLVAQKGEHAMRMSLEDGLEYALKRRRTVRSGRHVGSELQKSTDGLAGPKRYAVDEKVPDDNGSKEEILSPLERRVMDWHFANLEYGCAALLKEVSLPYWNQDDVYGGFGGAHCMIKGGYSNVVESLGEGLCIHLNHVVTDVSYCTKDPGTNDAHCNQVRVSTSNGRDFSGDAVLITVPLGCLKAESIKFSPSLPQWKYSSIQRLGFGVLNKVVLEFPEVFWDDSVDYFGATAEETNKRGQCFMFWNVKKTVGAPVLIALVVGKAAIDGQNMSSSDHVNHAVTVLRKLFGETTVPDPVASVVTDWGRDPYSYGAYSYVSVGASGEDYDILGRPVENCLFFAGEATCKEHPDTVGGAMMSGLREAVRIIDILSTGSDYTAEVDAMEAAQRHSYSERSEVRDIIKRLEAVELSNVLYKNSFDGPEFFTREGLLQDMFSNAKTAAGRLHLVKELLTIPVEVLKSFAGTKEGLSTLNSWILDSLGKDGTQLLRHCVRLLVLVSTDLLAVRLSGIGKTVKEKVCVHTSRDIRAIASQLVSVWIEVFRKEKASNGGLKLLRQSTALDSSKSKSNLASGKPPLRTHQGALDKKGSSKVASGLPNINIRKVKPVKLDTRIDSKSEVKPSMSQGSVGRQDSKGEEDKDFAMSEEEKAALAAAEAARAAELAAAEAYASSGARCNTSLQLPKIPSFHKFARREQYAQMDEADIKKKWSGGVLGRQDCISEIDSRNCRVRDWSVDFSAAGVNLDSSKMSVDNRSPRSHSNEIASQLNFREHSGESVAADSSIFTKAWVDSAGSEGIKDYSAIERWQSQAAAADSDFFHRTMHIRDEEESNMDSDPPTWKRHGLANESAASQVTVNRELVENQPRGPEHIKQAVVDYVASLLMPLYKARKIDKDGYKSIMKKTATKVIEQTTDAEKVMAVFEFLDFKRKNKIRAFVDKLIERHMATKPTVKS